jgi:hypothetical protein
MRQRARVLCAKLLALNASVGEAQLEGCCLDVWMEVMGRALYIGCNMLSLSSWSRIRCRKPSGIALAMLHNHHTGRVESFKHHRRI